MCVFVRDIFGSPVVVLEVEHTRAETVCDWMSIYEHIFYVCVAVRVYCIFLGIKFETIRVGRRLSRIVRSNRFATATDILPTNDVSGLLLIIMDVIIILCLDSYISTVQC